MRLSDVVAALDAPWYPIIGLLMFVMVFVAVVIRVMRTSRGEMDRCASLPLAAETRASRTSVPGSEGGAS
jgi:cbb3-type cytochrome oxidase subunit 3